MAAPVVLTGLGEDPTELLAAPEFDTIFDLFDRDGNGAIDFREASLGMKKLVPSLAMLDARSRALDVFLLFDNDASRTLDRFEFARFLSRFSVLAGEPFASLAPRLVALLRADDALTSADYHDAALLQSQPDTQVGMLCVIPPNGFHHTPPTQLYATLSRRKLDDLFDLMDHDGDGLVSTDVLQARLHALLQVARLGQGARVAAEACAVQELAAMGGSLTPRQFHGAMARVADSARLQLREVLVWWGGVWHCFLEEMPTDDVFIYISLVQVADAMLVLPEDVHVG